MPLLGVPGIGELLLILVVVVFLFGGKKLPELGGAIGESIKNFKKGVKEDGKKDGLDAQTTPPPQVTAGERKDETPPT
jgi:sec-independent protein translocase protein TatA